MRGQKIVSKLRTDLFELKFMHVNLLKGLSFPLRELDLLLNIHVTLSTSSFNPLVHTQSQILLIWGASFYR
jgi:hypothetical protein